MKRVREREKKVEKSVEGVKKNSPSVAGYLSRLPGLADFLAVGVCVHRHTVSNLARLFF